MDFGDSSAAAETRLGEDVDWSSFGAPSSSISSRAFYSNYHGHKLKYCVALAQTFRQQKRSIIWLVGDSSMDNKHWLFPDSEAKASDDLQGPDYSAPACNGYEQLLNPPRCIKDVCYWVNFREQQRGGEFVCLNTAVEASTLKDRTSGLLGHDVLVRDFLQPQDVIVCSIGGNDIALRPSLKTMASVAWLALIAKDANIDSGSAYGFGHLKNLFCQQLQEYLRQLCAKTKPSKVLVCMIYNPCQNGEGWADPLLNLLGYSADRPEKVKRVENLLETTFREAICQIRIDGVDIVPVALSRVLDSKNESHYEMRVEPSAEGGRVMSCAFCDIIHQGIHNSMFSSKAVN